MLALEIEFLTGAYRAGLPDASGPEWPPHPERVFSALVQAWGDGGRDANERAALEWLECQPAPLIEASHEFSQRDSPTVFVPPNDSSGAKLESLPDRRARQSRTFQAAIPTEQTVRLHWETSPPANVANALAALAHRCASLGHSASLARFLFREDVAADRQQTWIPSAQGGLALRAVYPGRLADLEYWYSGESGKLERPRSRRTVNYRPAESTSGSAIESAFGGPDHWFVFEDAGTRGAPDVLAFAQVSRRIRDALMSVGPQPAPELLTGHAEGGAPTGKPHLAIIPLANVGWEHSSGDLLGFALVLPRQTAVDERASLLRAIAAFARDAGDRSVAKLRLTAFSEWLLEHTPLPSRASLKPGRYCAASRVWASSTPVMLDRFPDGDDPAEEGRIIAAACAHVGLPLPVDIEIHKHSAIRGSNSAYPARGRKGLDWSFPTGSKLASRPRRHVVLRFQESVRGPVLLGAGRYHGFGLCLPIEGHDK